MVGPERVRDSDGLADHGNDFCAVVSRKCGSRAGDVLFVEDELIPAYRGNTFVCEVRLQARGVRRSGPFVVYPAINFPPPASSPASRPAVSLNLQARWKPYQSDLGKETSGPAFAAGIETDFNGESIYNSQQRPPASPGTDELVDCPSQGNIRTRQSQLLLHSPIRRVVFPSRFRVHVR